MSRTPSSMGSTRLLWVASFVASLAGCSCSAGDGAADSAALLDADEVEVSYPDTGVCAPDPAPSLGYCPLSADNSCQTWAEYTLPGWDVVAGGLCNWATSRPTQTCVRADTWLPYDSGMRDAGGDSGEPGFEPLEFLCGSGPACEPGYQCARRLGDPSIPRTCVCATDR